MQFGIWTTCLGLEIASCAPLPLHSSALLCTPLHTKSQGIAAKASTLQI